jgi:hypothetical protein
VAAQAVGAQRQAQREAEAASKIPIKTAVETPEYFQRAKAYMAASGQKPQQPDESNEDFFNRFMSERRFNETSVLYGGSTELSRLINATPEEKKAIAEGRDLYNRMEEQTGIGPLMDYGKGLLVDSPLYALSGGVGSVALKEGVRALAKPFLKREATEGGLRIGSRVGVGLGEAALGGQVDITEQKLERETKRVFGDKDIPDLDYQRMSVAALFSGVVGIAVPVAADAAGILVPKKSGEALAKAFDEKGIIIPPSVAAAPTRAERALVDPMTEQMDKVYAEYLKNYGRTLLDKIDPANTLTDSKLKEEYSKAAIRIAMRVIDTDPTFVLKPNEQISTAINNVLKNMDQINDAALEKAMKDVGITPEELGAIFKTTTSDAARSMQSLSVAARAVNQLRKSDIEFDKKMRDLYSFDDEAVSSLSRANQIQRRINREWKAFLTSGVDTTARNTISVGLVMPLKSGVQFMEGFIYTSGKSLYSLSEGKAVETFKKGMGDTVKDTFDVWLYMADPRKRGLSADVMDQVLRSNPNIRNTLTSALQETGNKDVLGITRWANSFNVVMDSFVRRNVFVASVESQLRRQGKDLYKDFLAKDLDIPTDIISKASTDALKTTFSYMPRVNNKAVSSVVERGAETAASYTVKMLNNVVGLNYLIPFPRYISGAMGYIYRYSPVGFIGATEDIGKSFTLEAAGQLEKATVLRRQALEKTVQAATGMALLAGALEVREKNPDLPWNELPTQRGTAIDTRPLGPQAVYLAMAEVHQRIKQGTVDIKDFKDATETLLGFKLKAGSGDSFLDKVTQALTSEFEGKKFAIGLGKSIGDIAGGFTQPFVVKQLFDVINNIREEGTVVRDPNVIESQDAFLASLEAGTKRVMGRLPVAKEQLPEAAIRLTDQEVKREGEYFNRLVGFRQVIKRNPVETEIIRLNLDPFKLYGTSSGVTEYDRKLIKEANKRVLEDTPVLMKDNTYKVLPDVEKNIRLTNAVRKSVEKAKEKVNLEYKLDDLSVIYRKKYNNISRIRKRAINDRFAADNNGVSFEEAVSKDPKKWPLLDKYEIELRGRVDDTK